MGLQSVSERGSIASNEMMRARSDHLNGPRLSINGQDFVAIRGDKWAQISKPVGIYKASIAGYVRVSGVKHVLVQLEAGSPKKMPNCKISSILTGRELQIAHSIADGKCDKVIAFELVISEYTVREHVRRIFCKLNVKKRSALVARLLSSGDEE